MKFHHWAVAAFFCLAINTAWGESDWLPAGSGVDAQWATHSELNFHDLLQQQQDELASLRARMASLESLAQPDVALSSPTTGRVIRMWPSDRPDIPEGFNIGFDGLAWKVFRDGLDYATAFNFDDFGAVESISPDYHGGFRLHVGYVAPSGWEAAFGYTYFHSADTAAMSVDPADAVILPNKFPAFISFFTDAAAEYRFDYDVFDFELSRWMTFGNSTVVRLFGGFRYASIDQTMTSLYVDTGFDETAVSQSRQNVDAYGLRFGGEAHLRWTSGLGVFGRLAASVLAADSQTSMQIQLFDAGLLDDEFLIVDNHYQAVPVLEAAAGVSWKVGPIEIAGGYELATWFTLARERQLDVLGLFETESHDVLLAGFFGRLTIAR